MAPAVRTASLPERHSPEDRGHQQANPGIRTLGGNHRFPPTHPDPDPHSDTGDQTVLHRLNPSREHPPRPAQLRYPHNVGQQRGLHQCPGGQRPRVARGEKRCQPDQVPRVDGRHQQIERSGHAVLPAGTGMAGVRQGYHSNQTLVTLAEVGIRSYVSEPERGRRNWRSTWPVTRYMPTGGGFAARAGSGCCVGAANGWNVPTRISTPPAGYAGCICADTATSSSACSCRSAA